MFEFELVFWSSRKGETCEYNHVRENGRESVSVSGCASMFWCANVLARDNVGARARIGCSSARVLPSGTSFKYGQNGGGLLWLEQRWALCDSALCVKASACKQ